LLFGERRLRFSALRSSKAERLFVEGKVLGPESGRRFVERQRLLWNAAVRFRRTGERGAVKLAALV
jgi:hypothetical protein